MMKEEEQEKEEEDEYEEVEEGREDRQSKADKAVASFTVKASPHRLCELLAIARQSGRSPVCREAQIIIIASNRA